MAVGSEAASDQMLKSPKKKDAQKDAPLSSPAKRNKSPGIRLIHGRIYDPINGKTCHQVWFFDSKKTHTVLLLLSI